MAGARTLTLTFTLCFSALFLAACGDSSKKLLPVRDADQLTAWLDQVGEFSNQGSCDSAGQTVIRIIDRIEQLPPGVDEGLRARLREGAQSLQQLVNDPAGCTPASTSPSFTPTTPTETTPSGKEKPAPPGHAKGTGGTPSPDTSTTGTSGGTPPPEDTSTATIP